MLLSSAWTLWGCTEENPLLPPALRFGQVGEIRLQLSTPLGAPGGVLQQSMVWRSEGAWQLDEEMLYRGRSGGRIRRGPPGNQNAFAASYATVIAQVNETPGLRLFIPELDPGLAPNCGTGNATVVLEIVDTGRGETARWTRCANGPLTNLVPQGAGPDLDASRVIAAAAAVRDLTLGDGYRSPFLGSLPFATLDRGEDSGVALTQSLVFLPVVRSNGTFSAPPSWASFWNSHTRGTQPLPTVDWGRDMVLVGAVGLRREAGDSVRVRRILRVTDGAIVDLVQRVPGDFCSPAARTQYPFHIVVVPLTPSNIRFGTPVVERVPCGL